MMRNADAGSIDFWRRPFVVGLLLFAALLLVGCRVQTVTAPDKTELPAAGTAVATDPAPTPTGDEPTDADSTSEPAPAAAEQTLSANYSEAANADVLFVEARETTPGVWSFSVTVAHPDTGWEDYADGWDVVLPDGTVVKPNPDDPFTRLLLHPHENEQPFTRSQSGIEIPGDVEIVTVRAHDLVDGFGGREVRVDVTASTTTDDYEVRRFEE